MQPETDIGWGLSLKVWWHIFWRFVVFGMLAGGATGFVIGFIGGLLKHTPAQVAAYTLVICLLLVPVVQVWVVKRVLVKKNRIGAWRLMLVRDGAAA